MNNQTNSTDHFVYERRPKKVFNPNWKNFQNFLMLTRFPLNQFDSSYQRNRRKTYAEIYLFNFFLT